MEADDGNRRQLQQLIAGKLRKMRRVSTFECARVPPILSYKSPTHSLHFSPSSTSNSARSLLSFFTIRLLLQKVLEGKGSAAEMDAAKFTAGLRVLAVDDDRTDLAELTRVLNFCNYNNVTTVTDASMALDMLRARKDREDQFDLVISDVFMPGGIDGFKLLELISLEMDIPVIVLSANDEMETMVKAIKHGACDYLVKPACPEKVRKIWMHVLRKSKSNPRNTVSSGNDNLSQIVLSVDDENGDKDDAKHTRKQWKKNRKDGDGAEKGEDKSTQQKERVEWSRELHSKFVDAINHIGLDKAVPKKILEVMNVDGITRENVASHLQKFRMHLKKRKEGTFKYSAFVDEQQAWLNGKTYVNCNLSVPKCSSTNISNEHPPLGTRMSFPSSCYGISFASKLRASILGSNKGIPFDHASVIEETAGGEMSACHVPLQSPELANRPSIQIESSSTDQVATSSHLPLQSPELVNQPYVGMFNQVVREPPQFTRFRNSSNSCTTGMPPNFPGIGQDVGMSVGPSQRNNILMNQLPRLVASSYNVPSSRNEYQNQMAGVMRTTPPMVSFNEQATLAPLNVGRNESSIVMPVNNFALGSSSSTTPALSNLEICNSIILTQMQNGGGPTGNFLEVGNIGHQAVLGDQDNNNNNQLTVATREMQIENYVMPAQVLSAGVATGNLPKVSNIYPHPIGDQVNGTNELPTGTSEAQNGAIDDIQAFFTECVPEDVLNNDDAFINGNMEFAW